MTSFSAAGRPAALSALSSAPWDLLIIGGGVTGAGAAFDAATRGMRVALVEAGDIGGGTSSRSSRLVHGGLRYLETYDFHLVWEASAERARLLRLAPHLVRPLPFLFPLYRHGPVGPLKLRAGMWLYDLLSGFRNIRGHRMLTAAEVAREEPALRDEGLLGAALYYDAAVDDARLALAAARAAAERGATVLPRAAVEGFERGPAGLSGVRVRDLLGGGEHTVRARVVLNATGPWSDRVRRIADPDAAPRLRTTKGVHIMVPRARVGNHHAVTLRSPLDNRVMFVLPWGDFTYVGTTDTDYSGDPAEVAADDADIRYLLDSANATFPSARLTEADVLSTWAGLRPLLAPTGAVGESATSREHEIWWDASGLLNIAGGKLTTYRVMAKEAVDEAVNGAPARSDFGPSRTADTPLPGAPSIPWDDFRGTVHALAARLQVESDLADALATRHGADAERILALVGEDPGLRERITPALPYILAEVVFAAREEMALTLEDVMVRRTHLFYESPDGASCAAERVARLMAVQPGIGWDEDQVHAQVSAYRHLVERNR